MTQKDKELLLRDLCSRLPYGVNVEIDGYYRHILKGIDGDTISTDRGINYPLRLVKPYLRPMSSMTKDEEKELGNYLSTEVFLSIDGLHSVLRAQRHTSNFLYSRHLDILGLIEKGLALEAPEDMYKI